jgi:hypothetical protein
MFERAHEPLHRLDLRFNRRLLLFAVTGVLVACAPRGREVPPDAALLAIDAVERAIAARDWPAAHTLVDYRYRLDEVLGDVWRAGSRADQDDLEALTRGMFEDTSEAHLERFVGKPMQRSVTSRTGPHLWVESHPRGDAKSFVWRYRLTRRGDSWSITQREFRVSGMSSDSTRFWPMAQSRIATQFGRAVDLRELTANLPSVMGTLRARSIRIPALSGQKAP